MKEMPKTIPLFNITVAAAMPHHTLCDSNRKVREKSVVVRLYKFPEDQILQRVWLKSIRRELSFKLTAHSCVCSAHFIGGVKDKNKIPTLFPCNQKDLQQYSVSTKENHSDSKTCYTDSEGGRTLRDEQYQ